MADPAHEQLSRPPRATPPEKMIVAAIEDVRDRQAVLSDELHHRVQNTLAIVLALARITARSVKTIDEFQVAFGDRVQAMARTNALLLRGKAQAIDVRAALELELEPYWGVGSEITLACEPLCIAADAALSLSLLIHELATNAAKYGALSRPGGRLSVRCIRGAPGGQLTWDEYLPPGDDSSKAAAPAQAAGTGSLLIDRLARDLGGSAILNYRDRGLLAAISFSLESTAPPR